MIPWLAAIACLLAFSMPAAAQPESFAAKFTETRSLPGIEQPLVLHGTLRFTPGKHLLWAINEPYSYRFVISAGHIKQVMPDGSIKRQPLSEVPWAAALFKLFSGVFGSDREALSRYFKVTRKGEKLLLLPRSKVLAKWVTRITAVGHPLPRKVTIEQSDGSRTRLTFTPIDEASTPPPAATTQ